MFNENSRTIRTHEYAEYKLMPETANKYMTLFHKLFVERGLIENIDYSSVMKNFKRIGRYDELENEVTSILNAGNIDFKIHHKIKINDKEFNFDFMIFKNKEPYMAVEATKIFSNSKESTSRIRTCMKIAYLDHRFQHLKQVYPKIKTMMIIKTFKAQENLTRRLAKREILNTRFCLVNEDINRILDFI